MPVYVYGCNENKGHHRQTLVHGMKDNPDMRCEDCGAPMHRIPQTFDWARHPSHGLFQIMDKGWERWKAKEKARQQRIKQLGLPPS